MLCKRAELTRRQYVDTTVGAHHNRCRGGSWILLGVNSRRPDFINETESKKLATFAIPLVTADRHCTRRALNVMAPLWAEQTSNLLKRPS